MQHWTGWLLVVLGLLEGGWLSFDGMRALLTGDYVTPEDGQYAGELGPWAHVVSALGLDPRSTLVKSLHVTLGLFWLAAVIGFTLQLRGAWFAMLACAILTIWYLPIGTLLSVVQLILLFASPLRPAALG